MKLMRQILVVFSITFISLSGSEVSVAKTPYKMKLSAPLPGNLFVELAKKVNPTIVNISTVMGSPSQVDPRFRDPFWEFFEQFMGPPGMRRRGGPRQPQSIGTGFIIDKSGLIVTNSHVVSSATEIEVQLAGDTEKYYKAEIIGDDPRLDIALIKIDAGKDLPFADLGDSDEVEVGEWVAAFGNPYGHSFSMSKGIISAKQRTISELSPVAFLQTDASINPGNSGGPLVNTKGKVIGVNTAIDARAQGIGFAIPINEIKKIRPQLEKFGRVARGYIGVSIDDISLRAVRALNLKDTNGALILDVEHGGPADKGDVEPYDVVIRFDKSKIQSASDLVNAVKDTPIGKKVKVVVIRSGKRRTLDIEVGSRPGEVVVGRKEKKLERPKGKSGKLNTGLELVEFSSSNRKRLAIEDDAPVGPIISDVEEGSPAWRAGMRVGDVVIDVNKSRTKDVDDVFENLRRGDNLVRVFNSGRINIVFLRVP